MATTDPRPSEARSAMRKLQHDLRTSVGQVLGYTEILEEEFDDRGLDELRPDLERIRAAANTLLAQIDGITGDVGGPSTPTAAAPAQPAVATDATGTPATGIVGRLLVVDDEEPNRDLLRRWLSRHGHEIVEAADGHTALRLIGEQEFDLVLLDIVMDDMDGFETLARIRGTHGVTQLPVIVASSLSSSDDLARGMEHGANDYVTKPFDPKIVAARVQAQLTLRSASREVEDMARQLELRNAFLRQTFGRYLSDEVVANLLEKDEGLEISGEVRRVSVLLADLRGFTALTESLQPVEIVSALNTFLGAMADVIRDYGGTVDEFLGDAILAHFGALTATGDESERAVACAVAMQLAMAEVNRSNASRGLPAVAMGIGIATGEVIVGNIGSERRSKHTVIGSAVNLAARIESYTIGGEVLISDETAAEVAGTVEFDRVREVWPKGFETPMRVHRVIAVGGRHGLRLPDEQDRLAELAEPIAARFAVLEGKSVPTSFVEAAIVARSASGARIQSAAAVAELADLRIEFAEADGTATAYYAKVVDCGHDDGMFTVRFSARSTQI